MVYGSRWSPEKSGGVYYRVQSEYGESFPGLFLVIGRFWSPFGRRKSHEVFIIGCIIPSYQQTKKNAIF